ncbi:cilia- and flagella-associated protein 74-like [Orussus abietinus]|uniref:cilia- and flagella-associated protein 74-like n=1 Tax=Orussus abietinus TaxID=222816 RepID=UPI0006254421|nr:cilia- and flagella-associated protein 74-like [Orussus abietinus]
MLGYSEGNDQERNGLENDLSPVFEDSDTADRIEQKIRNLKAEEIHPRDKCFYANPGVLEIKGFKANKSHLRKVSIYNKSQKWAYLRFLKIESDSKNPKILKIDKLDAVKLKPGLHVSINVTIEPLSEEEVTAEIIFLTLNADDTKNFHEFRIPVKCTPKMPEPIIYPSELRYMQKMLTIENRGSKSFSFDIPKRNEDKDIFTWQFLDDNPGFSESSNSVEYNLAPRVYRIEIPPKSGFQLNVNFSPQYIGLHHDVFKFDFEADGVVFKEQNVPMWGETTGLKVYVDPPIVDLGIIMADSGVYQTNFDVINTGAHTSEIVVKTPKKLDGQIRIFPKSTFVQPESSCTILVKLIPETDFSEKSKGYYDCSTNILSIPIHIHSKSADSKNAPAIILKIIATLTTARALVLEPDFVTLGRVHTKESVFAEIRLTNKSLLPQEYGFLDIPYFMEIQPNHGFGKILPGKTIRLFIIYSASLADIPRRHLRANGTTGDKKFELRVVTLAQLAGSKYPLISKLEKPLHKTLKLPLRRPLKLLSKKSETDFKLKMPKRCLGLRSRDPRKIVIPDFTQDVSDHDVNDSDSFSTLENHSPRMESFEFEDTREEKNVVEVFARIVDHYCELSKQIIKFPDTPCESFSIATLEVHGFNMASSPPCICGLEKNNSPDFEAWFEFKCTSKQIRFCPREGCLGSSERRKISVLFAPKLAHKMVYRKTQEIKAEKLRRDSNEAELESEKTGRNAATGAEKEKSRYSGTKMADAELSECDKLPGENFLLENFENYVATVNAVCIVGVRMKNGTRRDERNYIKLTCPVVKPDILILNSTRVFSFGPTAIGTSSRKFLSVKNISNKNVKVDVTLLNPIGPYYMPPGKMIEPGSVLTLPITYTPKLEEDKYARQFFEVRAAGTRTIWRLAVSGSGVIPSWEITPEMVVARLTAKPGKSDECRLTYRHLFVADVACKSAKNMDNNYKCN